MPSRIVPDNVSVSQGVLKLRSNTKIKNLNELKNPASEVWVDAACITSKITAGYGYYEARIKASRLSMSSSFWLQGEYSEIDPAEQFGAPEKNLKLKRYMLMNTHYFPDGWKTDKATPVAWRMPSGAADQYHVYGVWWKDRHTVWFYHNGRKVAETSTGGDFLEPMRIHLDTEAFLYAGLPSVASLRDATRNVMRVDWIRSWRLVPQGNY